MSLGIDGGKPDDDEREDPVLVEWAAELAERMRTGQTVDWDELDRRHPQQAQALRGLLPAFDLLSKFGNSSQLEITALAPLSEPLGELGCLGDFLLLREVGRGGMGIVYEARQLSLGRRVALKILPQSLALDRKRLRRFQLEAQAAALLHHSHIVPVHAVGSDRGVHYYAMQFIDGRTLADLIRDLRSGEGNKGEPAEEDLLASKLATQLLGDHAANATNESLTAPRINETRPARGVTYFHNVARMGRQAAEALEHAHQQGVIHRDVKPGNLMIDRSGHLWITDFGLARLLDDPGVTMTNDLLGTIRYMSPEVARGRPAIVDHRSDLYSLGVTLYELLALWPAFQGSDRAEVLRKILEEDPEPLRRLDRTIPVDLETIVHKTISKDPERRYATAGDMAEDLRRYLENLPILARRPTIVDRAAKWSHRHRPVVILVACFLLLAFAGLIADLTWSNRWLRSHNDRLAQALAQADEHAQEARRQRAIAQTQLDLARRHQGAETLRRARQALDARQIELAQEILHDEGPGADGMDHRGFAWRYLWRQSRREFRQLWGHQGPISGFNLAPDGRALAIFDYSGRVLISRLKDGRVLEQPRLVISTHFAESNFATLSADGCYVVAGSLMSEGPSRGIEVFDCQTGRRCVSIALGSGESIHSVAFDEAGKRFAAVSKHSGEWTLTFYNLTDPAPPRQSLTLGKDVSLARLSPDSRKICLQRSRGIELADSGTAQVLVHLAGDREERAWHGSFSPDGRFVVLAFGGELVVWESRQGRLITRMRSTDGLVGFDWSPRGRYLSWAEESGRVGIIETASGNVRELVPRSSTFKVMGFSPSFSADETLISSGQRRIPGGSTPTKVWNVESGQLVAEFPNRSEGRSVTFIPGGHDMLLCGNARLGIWTLHPALEPDVLAGHRAEAWSAAFSPDGKVLATSSDDTGERQTIRLWDPNSGKQLAGWKGHSAMIPALAFSPDGRTLASASLGAGRSGPANVRLWDASTHALRGDLRDGTGGVRAVAFSPDGQWLAKAGDDGSIRLWNLKSNSFQVTLTGHTAKVDSLAFSPDGKLLASASNDATVRLWDVSTGQARAVLQNLREVFAVRFAPDGSILAAVNELGELKLWHPTEGRLIRTIPGDSQELRALAFSPDSSVIAAAGKGKVIHLWDVVTGQEILTLEGHKAQINALAFSPDGSLLASCSHDGAVRLWRASSTVVDSGLTPHVRPD